MWSSTTSAIRPATPPRMPAIAANAFAFRLFEVSARSIARSVQMRPAQASSFFFSQAGM